MDTESSYLTLTEAAKLCPGRHPGHQTLIRWIKKGVRGVRLRAVYTQRWYTTSRWLEEFLEQKTAARLPVDVPVHDGQRADAAQRASKRMAEKWGRSFAE